MGPPGPVKLAIWAGVNVVGSIGSLNVTWIWLIVLMS